jgi:uncharacterized protein YbaR (Trm112 family)
MSGVICCPVCDREYKSRGGLSKHMKNQHPDKENPGKIICPQCEEK